MRTWGKEGVFGLALVVLFGLPSAGLAQFKFTTNNGSITITSYTGTGGDVTIPDTISGLPVTSIESFGYVFSPSITGVNIGNSVTNISDVAFGGCYFLATITVGNFNTAFSSVDGILFDYGQTTVIVCPLEPVLNFWQTK